MNPTRGARSALHLAMALGMLSVGACAKPDDAPEAASSHAIKADNNELRITGDNRILWNGSSVTEALLAALLKRSTAMENEPELTFRPEAVSSYEKSARVLQIVRGSGVTKLGFIGNEQYAAEEPLKSQR